MDYNAQHAMFNGHKVWGYGMDRETKKYVVDEDTAPFVQRMFAEYAAGKAMQEICDEFNAQGLRTTRGAKFGVKTMNKMLQNRAYIGEYRHGDIVVLDGMPALVDVNTFNEVQARFALSKRKGSQRANGKDGEAPRYWLTGKLFCGECGASMQGVHGTSGTGRKYYLLLLQSPAGEAVRQEENAQGAGRGARDDTVAGSAGRYREPCVAGGGRRSVLSG